MPRTKLRKRNENGEDNLVIQPWKPEFDAVKKNRSSFFWNENPIVLELACGKWEYSTGLAPHYPDKNFIGIDIKGPRLRYGAQMVKELGLKNVAFLRAIIHHLDQFFGKASVEEIRIIHPDPRPKGVDERRRLTCPRFLNMYQDILIPGGLLKLKTDDLDLFRYSLETLKSEGREIIDYTEDLYVSPLLSEHYDIKTNFEIKFHEKGRSICYLKARFSRSTWL